MKIYLLLITLIFLLLPEQNSMLLYNDEFNANYNNAPLHYIQLKRDLTRRSHFRPNVRLTNDRHAPDIDELKAYEEVEEGEPETGTKKNKKKSKESTETVTLDEIKKLVSELLKKLDQMEEAQHAKPADKDRKAGTNDNKEEKAVERKQPLTNRKHQILSNDAAPQPNNEQWNYNIDTNVTQLRRKKKNKFRRDEEKWGPWTDWTACSVTCGRGREIRWRHCLSPGGCADGAETEMAEKSCQLPECSPTRLFGFLL